MKHRITKKEIDLRSYSIKVDNLEEEFLIAVVADLHDRNPSEVIEIVRKQKPDVILLPGDTLERRDTTIAGFDKSEMDKWMKTSRPWRVICKCIKMYSDITGITGRMSREYSVSNGRRLLIELSKIAPCIMSVGNHEWYFLDEDYSVIKNNNVVLLDNSDCSIIIKNQNVSFGGLSTKFDLQWLEKFSKRDAFKILLCHHPEYYINYIRDRDVDTFDLIVSGHTHGGQWCFFNRGLFAPGQGLFPKYVKGTYGRMIVSAGLSNTAFIPRIGNPKEVVMVKVHPKGKVRHEAN